MDRLKQIAEPLLSWFDQNARKLPWRENPLPYYVWVSEIMLQQTRVEAVKPFFARFTEELPDVAALAACEEERLLKLWEGLGYYNRVRNMQKAAWKVMEEYDGKIPDEYEELLTLPGIGSYTAGAIASIAYGKAAPAVDGNVLRVITRITGNYEEVDRQTVKKQIEQQVQAVIPLHAPGTFNQALMELGATVCLPNGVPLCDACPLYRLCYAQENGCQMELPVKAAKKARKLEQRTVLIIRDSRHAAIGKRPPKGLLAGLYELPNFPGHLQPEEVILRTRELGFEPVRVWPLRSAKHIFSHVEWHMNGYMVLVEEQEERSASDSLLFVEPQKTEADYPIPAAFAAYTEYLSIRLGQEKYKGTGGE